MCVCPTVGTEPVVLNPPITGGDFPFCYGNPTSVFVPLPFLPFYIESETLACVQITHTYVPQSLPCSYQESVRHRSMSPTATAPMPQYRTGNSGTALVEGRTRLYQKFL